MGGHFRLQVILRIGAILIVGWAAYYFASATPFWLLSVWFALFAILMIIGLIRYVERTHRDLANFLMAIHQNDFSTNYPEREKSQQLYHAFNVITTAFSKLRNEKESSFRFLKTVVEHSGVPLLAYEEGSGDVSLINQAFKELFHLPHLTRIDVINRVSSQLYEVVKSLQNEEKLLVKTVLEERTVHLSVQARQLILLDKPHKILAFHDIRSELDQNEVDSWQRLIRVLTHEIKNSAIPISTLSEVISQMVSDHRGESKSLSQLSMEEEEDLRHGLQTIEKRSKGLVRFVSAYSDLSKIPKPQLEQTNISELLRSIVALEKSELEKQGIATEMDIPPRKVMGLVDRQMIEQVLINLVKNAIEALTGHKNGKIIFRLYDKERGVSIQVSDNGPGMDQETLENIFVPFFTTKGNGNGIGLSLSRQIVRAHGGYLRVKSAPGEGSTFTVELLG